MPKGGVKPDRLDEQREQRAVQRCDDDTDAHVTEIRGPEPLMAEAEREVAVPEVHQRVREEVGEDGSGDIPNAGGVEEREGDQVDDVAARANEDELARLREAQDSCSR